jgi:hypothetical protein
MRIYVEKPKVTRIVPDASKQDRRSEGGIRGEVHPILRLQRTIGNQAVQRLLQGRTDDQRQSPASIQAWFNQLQSVNDARGGAGEEGDLVDQRVDGIIARDNGDGDGDGATAGAGAIPASAAPPAPARPRPINVRNGPSHAPIDSGDSVGMSIAITITSSSGVDADMAAIQDSEQVSLSKNHTGSMVGLAPIASSTSSFMPGFPIPDDQHATSRSFLLDRFDNQGGAGSFEKEQLDIFTDAAGGVTSPTAIPSSGYIIKREFSSSGTSVVLKTSKRGANVTVGGFSSAAGPSAMQSDTVTLRT